MKKKILFILSSVLILSFGACNKTKTYAELLKEEEKAIDQFINKNGLVILSEYPKDSTFKDNEYFLTPEGLYMNVMDKGTKKPQNGNEICFRIRYYSSFKEDTTKYLGNMWGTGDAYTYIYGNYYSTISWGQGLTIPLSYVGEDSKVKLIVPSKLGTSTDANSVSPVYYDYIWYSKFK